jgi:hypothetical protein
MDRVKYSQPTMSNAPRTAPTEGRGAVGELTMDETAERIASSVRPQPSARNAAINADNASSRDAEEEAMVNACKQLCARPIDDERERERHTHNKAMDEKQKGAEGMQKEPPRTRYLKVSKRPTLRQSTQYYCTTKTNSHSTHQSHYATTQQSSISLSKQHNETQAA